MSPPSVVSSLPVLALSSISLVDHLRLLRVRARGDPLAPPLGRRGRPGSRRPRSPRRSSSASRQLERALDVLARRLPVPLAPVAARPPAEDPRPEPVARDPRPLREVERLGEERQGRRDRGEPVAAAPEAEEHLGAVDVREDRSSTSSRARRGAAAPRASHRCTSAPTTRRAARAARGPGGRVRRERSRRRRRAARSPRA